MSFAGSVYFRVAGRPSWSGRVGFARQLKVHIKFSSSVINYPLSWSLMSGMKSNYCYGSARIPQ